MPSFPDNPESQPDQARSDRWFKVPGTFVTAGRDDEGRWLPGGMADFNSLVELKVMVALIHFTNSANGKAWPSINSLAVICDTSRSNISRAIRSLIDKKLIARVSSGNIEGETSRYRVLLGGPREATPLAAQEPLDAQEPQDSDSGSATLAAQVPQGSDSGSATLAAPGVPNKTILSNDDQTNEQTNHQTNGRTLWPDGESDPKPKTKRQAVGDHQQLIEYFTAAYLRSHKIKYIFLKRDAAHVQTLLKALGPADARAAIDRYLANREDFYVNDGHTLGLLISKLNRFNPRAIAPEKGTNGHHRPSNHRGMQENLTL